MKEFRIWEKECNEVMLQKYGVGIDDIPDMPYEVWYSIYRYSPKQAAKCAISTLKRTGF